MRLTSCWRSRHHAEPPFIRENAMMNARTLRLMAVSAGLLLCAAAASAQNPLIRDQFTADPTARVFEGRVYVYPSHDIRDPSYYTGRKTWFVMEDYHVFSSAN